MINKNRLIKLTQQLIRINSENPPGSEVKIARFVKNYLAEIGIKSRIYEFAKKRSNVIAVIKGKQQNHSLLITPHLDTVPRGKNWSFGPFSGKIYRDRIYGLGATDCKGNLAVSLEVIRSLCEENISLNYDLFFAATADEECGSGLGLVALLEKGILRPDAALVLDADDFDIIVTQKGLLHLKVKVQGKRAHGAYPWQGINAIEITAQIIRELKKKRFPFVKNKYLRAPTINVGTIKGGDKVNIVADWCEFELDLRFLPGTIPENLQQDLKKLMRKFSRHFKLEILAVQEPYSIPEAHTLLIQLKQAMRDFKIKPQLRGSEGATVITFFQQKNIPATATGFGSGGCAHSSNEYVKISNLYKGAQVLELFLKHYQS